MSGQIKYASSQGAYIIKFEGDIRVSLCASFDAFVKTLFSDSELKHILIDLDDADFIDSTALGLIAKVAALSKSHLASKPGILSRNPDINRLLDCMALTQVFQVFEDGSLPTLDDFCFDEGHCLDDSQCSKEGMYETVIEAHKNLMALSENNKEQFKELVMNLESEKTQDGTLSHTPSDLNRH